jgi:hypothetical protein
MEVYDTINSLDTDANIDGVLFDRLSTTPNDGSSFHFQRQLNAIPSPMSERFFPNGRLATE